MSYRGKDLDLRTADPVHSAGDLSGAQGGQQPVAPETASSPVVYVDDAVLACCNHAYDLALAYRAPEVRLEHLLNAMTRTDSAVAVMAAQGIDVTGLRHDTATLIATEAPIIYAAERPAPRRSQDLADALQSAAQQAEVGRGPVTVSDLLQTLLEMNPEQSGLVMLKRNAPGWPPRGPNETVRSEPLPPLLGGAYQLDPRYVAADVRPSEPPREWLRMPPPPAYYQAPPYQAPPYVAPQPGYFVAEPAPIPVVQQSYYAPEAVASPPGGASMADAVQNSRLDQLERTIRDLSAELSAERKAFGQLVGELNRGSSPQADMPDRYRAGQDEPYGHSNRASDSGALSADRLIGLERNVEAKFSDIARVWSVLGERLQALEHAVVAGRSDGTTPAGLVDRMQGLDDLGQTLNGISDRLAGLERQAAVDPATGGSVNLQPVIERLEAIERSIATRAAATVDLAPVVERLSAIDARVTEVSRAASTLGDRIGQFERKLDTGAGSTERTATQLGERLGAIEEAVAAQRNQVTQLTTNITADIKALGQTVSQSLVGERLQSLTSAFDRQRTEIATAVTQPINDRVGQLSGLLDTHRSETAQTMAGVSDKIAALEKLMQSFGQRTLDLHAAHGKDLVELHNALVKLNTNQQTLAASMDQWRLDNGNEFSTLVSRFESIERSSARPVQLLETLQDNMQTLQRTSAKREEQKSRFRQWLMGTDDWYGASWEEPEQKDRARPANGNATAPGVSQSAGISPARSAANPGSVRKG